MDIWRYSLGILLVGFAILALSENGSADYGVEIQVSDPHETAKPGQSATFSVWVNNTSDQTETILFSLLDDDLQWGSVNPESVELDRFQAITITVTVALPEYEPANLTTQERETLEGYDYDIWIKATCESDESATDQAELYTEIGDVYGASLELIGEDSVITYNYKHSSLSDRTESFKIKLINTGNRRFISH